MITQPIKVLSVLLVHGILFNQILTVLSEYNIIVENACYLRAQTYTFVFIVLIT